MAINNRIPSMSSSSTSIGWYLLSFIVITALITGIIVLATLRDRENTTVPDLVGDEIVTALLKLQERDLIPKVKIRYDVTEATKGTIVEQLPHAGSNVKVGKEVEITISRGRALFRMESFIGQNIEETHAAIIALESNHDATIQLGNIIYATSEEPFGTVIEQSPIPNSEVGTFTQLDWVVSAGAEINEGIVIPDLRGAHFDSALQTLLREQIPFRFRLAEAPSPESAYKIALQDPLPGTIIQNEELTLVIDIPAAVDLGFSFGIYEYTLAAENSDTPSTLSVRADLPNNQQRMLAEYTHTPQYISVPYLLPSGSEIMLIRDQNIVDRALIE